MTGPEKEQYVREIAALHERVRYLEEMEKEFAALARALKDSEERYRLLVEKILDGIFIAQDDHVKFPNPSMTDLLGYTAKELGAVPIAELIRPEDRERVLARYRRILAGENLRGTLAFGALRKGGDGFQAEVRAVPIAWEDRPAVLCLLRDVTRQVQLESQLQYAKKMEAVGTLAGGIAHDFNNHLQGISGYIQLLMMRGDRDRTEQGWLMQIERSVQRAAALTKQLLIFSRREESRLEPLDLNEVVRQAQKTLARTIPESIVSELRLAADLRPLEGDAVQLEHVLFNLGINAKDAMPDGGKIVIGTRNVRLDEAFCRSHVGVTPGDYVELSFRDTGHGMEQETLERIFEPFYTTKGVGSGIGLGLAIVYGIVQSHRGIILCESSPAAGTTFRIYLPAQERAAAAPEKEARKRADYRGVETIMIVDDEPDILDIGQNTLEQFGYTVLMARSGEEAVEAYSKRGREIDLVILDLGMPGMGGERCLQELLKMNPSVKVLIASGYAATQTVQGILEAGATGFMAKPYRLEDMLKKVREVLDGERDEIPLGD
ncbi:MAG: Blue-light-activated protein [Syntrophaceae bacterium PtaB.Bin038]|nr:MAG: Blue-light-activated protein [Syntrophaceae bacterium PtaB.Bin038]